MAVKCLNCGYEMSTSQEVTSTITHIASGIFSIATYTLEKKKNTP